jgi:predicted CXXCH cytochrome family protein
VRVLIRFFTRAASGETETRDRVFDGRTLTLGRGTNQSLQLKDAGVALSHARIYRRHGRNSLVCKRSAVVKINGSVVQSSPLAVGDVVEIGSNILRIFDPPKGVDLAFTFELAPSANIEDAVAEPRRLALAELGLLKRRLAWVFFIACLGIGLIIPMVGAMRDGGSDTLRANKLPSDQLWSPGPLHSAHSMLQTNCVSCHQKPFVQVRSEACLSCHASNLHRHIEQQVEAGFAPNLVRCTSCHSEHETPSRLVQIDQRICADCHAAKEAPVEVMQGPIFRGSEEQGPVAQDQASMVRIAHAADFFEDHPAFYRVREASQDRGLMFPHEVHLNPKGIKSPDGTEQMECGDCHQPETGGRRMRPVRMEQHCSRCHRLDFDPAEPQREVPHGDPNAVIESLTDYYSARLVTGNPDQQRSAQPERPIKLPAGADAASKQERDRATQKARTRALVTARDLFERRACAGCHVVSREAAKGEPQWKVEPVHLTSVWMPTARFDHSRHGTALTPCTTCHDAGRSSQASDVLMPRIETCRECHGGEPSAAAKEGLIASTCTMCHDFHAARNPLWVADTVAGKQEHTDEGQ